VTTTQVMTFKVRLGTRPPELNKLQDMLEARTRFMQWWQDQGGDPPAQASEMAAMRLFNGALPPLRISPETTLLP
jgi:hypothetical protein